MAVVVPADQASPLDLKLLGADFTYNKESMPSSGVRNPVERLEQGASPAVIGLYFSAHYCPSCQKYTPELAEIYKAFRNNLNRVCDFEVVFVSNDRSEEAFEEYMGGMPWPAIGYKAVQSLKMQLRDRYRITTIPALVLLDAKSGRTLAGGQEGRKLVLQDPSLGFLQDLQSQGLKAAVVQKLLKAADRAGAGGGQKQEVSASKAEKRWGFFERSFSKPLFALGHSGVSELHPKEMYMDEHAVRIRAGLLHIITWLAILNILGSFGETRDEKGLFAKIIYPIVAWDFVAAATMGLAPLAPVGVMATRMAYIFSPQPHWKPAAPKRFAWAIGLCLATTCFVAFIAEVKWLVWVAVLSCSIATWFECACGFCAGCFIYNNVLVPMFKLEACKECTM